MTPNPTAYFDWNATAPLRAEAHAAVVKALDVAGNPSSIHTDGRAARAVLEGARSALLHSVKAPTSRLVFTSGGTEAANLALRGMVQASAEHGERVTRLIVSAGEHECVLQTARHLAETVPGLRLTELALGSSGAADLGSLRAALMEGKGRAITALMLVNNETGVIQPVAKAAKIARENNSAFVCDAVQAWGRMPVDFDVLGADALILSAHKAGGPKGAGALILKEGVRVSAHATGGGQEFGLRAGTQTIAAAAGFAAIAGLSSWDWPRLYEIRDRLEAALLAAAPGSQIFGRDVPRLPNTICIAAPPASAEAIVMALDMDGVSISAGAACSSGKVTPSHVLSAMGIPRALAASAVRISFGPTTRDEEISRLISSWTGFARRATGRSAA
jgi:cysteine desulfurase